MKRKTDEIIKEKEEYIDLLQQHIRKLEKENDKLTKETIKGNISKEQIINQIKYLEKEINQEFKKYKKSYSKPITYLESLEIQIITLQNLLLFNNNEKTNKES